jgi:Protein of unknown function (DUF2934)
MPKSARSKKPVTPKKSRPRNIRHELTEDEIRSRAYDLYLQRDGVHGHDLDDWLKAERELAVGKDER